MRHNTTPPQSCHCETETRREALPQGERLTATIGPAHPLAVTPPHDKAGWSAGCPTCRKVGPWTLTPEQRKVYRAETARLDALAEVPA